MFESIFETTAVETAITLQSFLLAIGAALGLGFIISLVYIKTHKTKMPTQSFSLTLIMLPAVVTVIILLVGNSVARAFSLAGAFSIIRFRSAPGDAKDITYVLFTMAVGLAAGMGYILYAAVVTALLCAVMVLLEAVKFGHPPGTEKILRITIPENMDYQNAFDSIMKKYAVSSTLCKIRTTDLGSLYELEYSLIIKNDIIEKDFIDELRCRNGNLNITLLLNVPANSGEF